MLLNEFVSIKTNNSNYKKYKNLGYTFSIGDCILVKIEEVNRYSKAIASVRCDICGREKKITCSDYFKNISKYNLYTCSSKCSTIKKVKTCFENHGCEYPMQSEKIKGDLVLYFNNKYGVNYPAMLKKFEEKKQETNFKKYGIRHQMHLNENIYKIKQTKLKKYGNENYNNIDKCKSTKLIRYNNEYYNNHNKYENTCIIKYGLKYYNNTKLYKSNCLKKYGVENVFQHKDIKNKIRETNLKKYGIEYYQKTNEFKIKYKKTCLYKYGVESPMQAFEIHNKQQISSFKCKRYNMFFYRGTYELDFIKFCENNNIEIIKPDKVKYSKDGKIHYYFPDFYIPKYNLLIEIKSTYYFNLNKSTNLLKKEYSINSGYNFLFIMNKNYNELEKIIKSNDTII